MTLPTPGRTVPGSQAAMAFTRPVTLDSRWLRGPARGCAWLIWAAGLALGGFCLAGDVTGMAASTALLFLLFCPWVAWVGFLDRRRVA